MNIDKTNVEFWILAAINALTFQLLYERLRSSLQEWDDVPKNDFWIAATAGASATCITIASMFAFALILRFLLG